MQIVIIFLAVLGTTLIAALMTLVVDAFASCCLRLPEPELIANTGPTQTRNSAILAPSRHPAWHALSPGRLPPGP